MGMFDHIEIDKSIKIPLSKDLRSLKVDPHNFEFQTKDLDNILCVYKIKKNKKIYKNKKAIRYHGEIIFGTFYSTSTIDYIIDYKAKFTEGVLQSIKLVRCDSFSNEERKKKRKEIEEKIKKYQKSFYYKLSSFVRNTFGISVRFYYPKLFLYKKDYSLSNYGIALSELDTELLFKKGEFFKEFSFKFFGFGLSISNSSSLGILKS